MVVQIQWNRRVPMEPTHALYMIDPAANYLELHWENLPGLWVE